MAFFTPENGAHTSGSKYPRSELRQQPYSDLAAGSFHQLKCSIAVTALMKPSDAVTIGQAHVDGISGACSIFVEYAAGEVVPHMRDSACNGVIAVVGTGYKLGDVVAYSITIRGAAVTVTTDRGGMVEPYVYSWLPVATPVYFKAGNYLQVASATAEGSTVVIRALTTEHHLN